MFADSVDLIKSHRSSLIRVNTLLILFSTLIRKIYKSISHCARDYFGGEKCKVDSGRLHLTSKIKESAEWIDRS